MSFNAQCSHCKAEYQIEDQQSGMSFTCSNCNEVFQAVKPAPTVLTPNVSTIQTPGGSTTEVKKKGGLLSPRRLLFFAIIAIVVMGIGGGSMYYLQEQERQMEKDAEYIKAIDEGNKRVQESMERSAKLANEMMQSRGLNKPTSDKQIDGVKNGILFLDKNRTMEQVFSTKLRNLQWRKFTSESDKTVVQVTGIWKKDETRSDNEQKQLLAAAEELGLDFTIPMDGDRVVLQFVVNADGTFNFAYGELQDKNGKAKQNKNKTSTASSGSAYTPKEFLELLYK